MKKFLSKKRIGERWAWVLKILRDLPIVIGALKTIESYLWNLLCCRSFLLGRRKSASSEPIKIEDEDQIFFVINS